MKQKLIIFDFYRTIYNPETEGLFSGTDKILKKLAEKNILILITTGGKKRKKQIKKLKIEKFFSNIIVTKKKSIQIFKKAIKKSEIKPNEVIIIGDQEKEEIQIGKFLETKTIKVNPEKEDPAKTIKKSSLIKL